MSDPLDVNREARYRQLHEELAPLKDLRSVGARTAIGDLLAEISRLRQVCEVAGIDSDTAPADPMAEFELRGTTEIRAAAYRDAADIAMNEASRLYDDMGQKAAAGARCVADRLRRLADEAQQAEAVAHPATHRWAAETYDPLADEWSPGMRYTDRDRAVERRAQQTALAPLWADGVPVQRRLMRETTTYTVEAEGAQR